MTTQNITSISGHANNNSYRHEYQFPVEEGDEEDSEESEDSDEDETWVYDEVN